MSKLLRAIHEWLFTARCQGCPNRVRIIGSVWLGTRRRESAYCNACRSLDMEVTVLASCAPPGKL